MKTIREFQGYSGSKIYLLKNNNEYFVRKIGNVKRNYEKLLALEKLDFPVVKILDFNENILDLEYIPGLDIANYLIQYNGKPLSNFIISVIKKLKSMENIDKNYDEIFKNKTMHITNPFKNMVLDNSPKILKQSEYLGDFTLENILFNRKKEFIIIDQSTIEYDSWHFDLAKLNQDLTCKWFLRYKKTNLDSKLTAIKNNIENEFGKINVYYTVLMLFRIYNHAKHDLFTRQFLDNAIEKLIWKS